MDGSRGTENFMKEKEQFHLAKLKKGGEMFEISIDPDKAIDFKRTGEGDMKEIMLTDGYHTVNLSKFESGVYLIKFVSENRSFYKKLIKK